MLVVELRRDRVRVALVDHGHLGVAAVGVPAGEAGDDTQVLVAPQAEPACSTRGSEPSDTDAVADREATRRIAERVDDTDRLVTRNDTVTSGWQVALGQMEIGAAHSAGRDPYAHFAGRRLGWIAVDAHERSTGGDPAGLVDDPASHRASLPFAVGGSHIDRCSVRGSAETATFQTARSTRASPTVLDGIVDGRIDVAFRRWRRPTVKRGGKLRTVVGELAVVDVQSVTERRITTRDATRAGYASRAELLRELASYRDDGTLYRIELRLAGPDPRVALRLRADLDDDEVAELTRRLSRFDAASKHGPWTTQTLRLIEARPATLAADIAASVGRERAPFKADVRKLKELGLTESLDVGYRLSPRGEAYLARARP